MKKNILSIILLLIFTTQAFSHNAHYESLNTLKYELFRNGKSIGYHNYEFNLKNEPLNVKSFVKFKITKLGVNLYKYEAISEENFKQNQLINFSSKTYQNKKIKNTEINYDEKKKKINYHRFRESIIISKRISCWNLVES